MKLCVKKGERRKQRKMKVSFLFWRSLLASTLLILTCAANPHPEALPSFLDLPNGNKIPPSSSSTSYCLYRVSIKTSCSSPRYTRDAISLAFGDAYRNEVYAPRLDDPSSGAFERCSTDTFVIHGTCSMHKICYLYLRRNGRDGWTPAWVKVYGSSKGASFRYGTPLPNAVWYGFNFCPYYNNNNNNNNNNIAAAAS